MPAAIWALAIATFGIGTTEFVIAGLLPGIATEFGISFSEAGYMATSYALGVFVGAPLLIILGARVRQKTMLVSLMGELSAFVDVHVLLAMGITVLGPAAFFTAITYISPMMTELTGYSNNGVTGILFLFGLGLFIGNLLGGKLADCALMPLLYVTVAGQALVLFAFFFVVESRVASAICVLLMAGFGFASVSPIQRLVMDKARAAGAPNLAAPVNIGLFNLGNAIGAWLGGWVIALGFGFAAPNWVGGILSTFALLLAIASGWLTVTHGVKRKAAMACVAN